MDMQQSSANLVNVAKINIHFHVHWNILEEMNEMYKSVNSHGISSQSPSSAAAKERTYLDTNLD